MTLPDYHGGSIVNLMASIREGLGAPGLGYAPARLLAPERVRAARHVVVVVIDGLGFDYLMDRGSGGALREAVVGPLTSVCPPTTAAAIPVFLTGGAPQQHGLTGWFTWFRELGALVATLPFRPRIGGPCLADGGIDPAALAGLPPIYDALSPACHVIIPERIALSGFNRAFSRGAIIHPYEHLPQLFGHIEQTLREAVTPTYTYAYWSDLDHYAHEFGIHSEAAEHQLGRMDAAFGAFLRRIRGSDTLVIATADHGFIDSAPGHSVLLADHPELARCLEMPLSGEPRFAYCHVRPDLRPVFEAYARAELAEGFELYESASLVERGWFGLGAEHPELRHRLGHYTLVARENWRIKDWLPGERRYELIGVHGGMTRQEMVVPLVLAEC